jgi:aurora kinase, other
VCDSSDIQIGTPIGSGKNGAVYLVRHSPTGAIYAAKSFDWYKVVNDRKRIYRELDIQSNMKHPNIIPLICCIVNHPERFFVLVQLGQQDLFSYLTVSGPLDERRSARFLGHVLSALSYLHSFEIMHRDVKPENLILCGDVIKLGDFGAACLGLTASDLCGTEEYMAPEMLPGVVYTHKVDLWAAGVLLHEMLTMQVPVKGVTCIPDSHSASLVSLISELLCPNPSNRPEAAEALAHPWLSN